MSRVEFNFDLEHPIPPGAAHIEGLDGDILLQNARWFTRIRWAVVGVLFIFGMILQGYPQALAGLSMGPTAWKLLVLAGGLACLNLVFVFLLHPTRAPSSRRFIVMCTWLQILSDLMILTILVHEVGSLIAFIVFAYLFHIVLSCIFFVPRDSLLVTVLAAVLFLGCRALEATGFWPTPTAPVQGCPITLVNALSAVFIWFVVWYLTSSLSKAVRERDRKLATANELLIAADREKNLLMLRTTHDLKAPFCGIEANIEMLKLQDWDALPENARTKIESIELRAATLRERIKDILLLGELRKSTGHAGHDESIDLNAMLSEVIADLSAKAAQRGISLSLSPAVVNVVANRKQLNTLFANLIANAIVYSHENSQVEVTVAGTPRGASVRVADSGIGISEKAMPHIFEEYFRSPEAAQFNPLSTGLGLAIVKHIAQNLKLRVYVTSEQGKGTTFEVLIPYERS